MSIFSLCLFLFLILSPTPPVVIATTASVNPKDKFCIACGSEAPLSTPEGKNFQADCEVENLLQAQDKNLIYDSDLKEVPSLVYRAARLFKEDATFMFPFNIPAGIGSNSPSSPLRMMYFALKPPCSVKLLHHFTRKDLTMKENLEMKIKGCK